VLSRWAYPASVAYRDISRHGTLEDDLEMKELIQTRKGRRKSCLIIRLKSSSIESQESDHSFQSITQCYPITLRSGKKITTPEEEVDHNLPHPGDVVSNSQNTQDRTGNSLDAGRTSSPVGETLAGTNTQVSDHSQELEEQDSRGG
jgi:hypothetical protein